MRRLFPLLALALLPAALAAPVPRGVRPDFGTNGLLSRADLEKIAFDSRPALREGAGEWSDAAEAEEPEKRREDEPKKPPVPLRANRFDVAVHLPWANFRAGEQMPVYFVVRNNRRSVLGLNSQLDLSGPEPHIHGSGMSFDVRDCGTGKSVPTGVKISTNCGGGSLVDVPEFGFYCVRGDLNHLTARPLVPGEYEVDWRCGKLASAPVRFTVAASDDKPRSAAKRPPFCFYHLTHDSDERNRAERVECDERTDGPFLWPDCRAEPVRADAMAAALAVGPDGALVPDVRTIPTADRFVEAWAVWKPYRDGDRVAVTLRAVRPHERVSFDRMPELFLQIEVPDSENRERCKSPDEKLRAVERKSLTTPLTIEARLPDGWRERLGGAATARVAVIVASKPIKFPRGNVRVQEAVKEVAVESAEEGPRVWSGVVRSDFTELRLPR
jgi:hypothetical protein